MKIVKDFIVREIAGECILVPVGTTAKEFKGMISLTPSAQFIWENLEKVDSLEELMAFITAEFNVADEVARPETVEFIARLLKQGFIETTKADHTW